MSGNSKDQLARVVERGAELADLMSAAALLSWDQETKMPKQGVSGRSHVLATLAAFTHDKLTDPQLGDDLKALANNGAAPGSEEQLLVREFLRLHEREVRMPRDLVRALAELESRATAEWAEARAKADFESFAPTLGEVIRLKREQAAALGFTDEPYDALLDMFEPDMLTREIAPILGALRDAIIPMVKRISENHPAPETNLLTGPYETGGQDAFGREVVNAMGFDMNSGRLDISQHPFTSGIHAGDVRLTTRYKDDLSVGLFGTIHEAGHGLYEQGLPFEERRGVLGQATSLGIHESQSRMWENNVGRARPFWVHFYPRLQELFPKQLSSVSLDTFYRAINRVEPSFIRIEADEMTYNLHIVIRFELEREFMSGRLEAKDLADAWNAKYEEYLGITPPSADVGVLQDIHWASGLIGYFPTYTLGNLYAAQFYNAALRDMPEMERRFEAGDFLGLRDWLIQNVHRHGRRLSAKELVERASGKPFASDDFTAYLHAKFGELYP